MALLHNTNAKTDKILRKYETMIINRVTMSDFNYRINNIIKEHAKTEDLKSLEDKVIPSINEFTKRIDEFQNSDFEHTSIINRFDEVL